MMNEDDYQWYDNVELMKNELNHRDSENNTEIMKKNVGKMMMNEENMK